MTATVSERLYALLPAIARIRDADHGEPLRALLGVMEEELLVIENDIDRLYANCFVETCDEWVLPYIGDLIGARLLHAVSQRAFTANTLAYRRRKGTVQVLGALARDVTGWPARVVEYMRLVATMQHINSVEPDRIIIPNLRQLDELAKLDSPFERTARTGGVRSRGKYHKDQLGLFLWRLRSFPLERVRAVAASEPGCFYVNPLGTDVCLWSPSGSRSDLTASTELDNVPQPLRRLQIHKALESRRQALANGRTPFDPYFSYVPVLRIFTAGADGAPQEVPADQIMVAELDRFWTPPDKLTYKRTLDGKPIDAPIAVAVDPQLGRLAFPAGQIPSKVWVSYYYGFNAELGGGGYDRVDAARDPAAVQLALAAGDPTGVLTRLAEPSATDSPWEGANGNLLIELPDSDTYTIGPLRVPAGGRLELRSTAWQRPLLTVAASAAVSAPPTWPIVLEEGATLVLTGLLVQATLAVSGAPASGTAVRQARLLLRHSTLVPGISLRPASGGPAFPETASVQAQSTLAGLAAALDHCITGAIDLSATSGGQLDASDSIIDGARSQNPALRAPLATLARVTVLGSTEVRALSQTEDTLFDGIVTAPGGPDGGISYCYLPPGSQTVNPFRCQPALAAGVPGRDADRVRVLVSPWFASRQYGQPGYAQLDARCASELRNGASVEGEIGAFQNLKQALREENLRDCESEYLRFGLTLTLFPVS